MDEMDLGSDVNEPLDTEEVSTEFAPMQSDGVETPSDNTDTEEELSEDTELAETTRIESDNADEEELPEDIGAPEFEPDVESEEFLEEEELSEDVEPRPDYVEETENEELPEDVGELDRDELGEEEESDLPEDVEAEELDTSGEGELVEDEEAEGELGQEGGTDANDLRDGYGSLSEYMNAHNYGRDDFDTYSKDPEWQRLHEEEFPDWESPSNWEVGPEADDGPTESGNMGEPDFPEDMTTNETEATNLDELAEDVTSEGGPVDPERSPEFLDAPTPEQKGEFAPSAPGDYEAWESLEDVPFAGEGKETDDTTSAQMTELDTAGSPDVAQQAPAADYDRSAIYAKNNFAFDAAQANVDQANRDFENLRRWQPGPPVWNEGDESGHSDDLTAFSKASDTSVPSDWERIEDAHDLGSDLQELNTEYNPELNNEWSNNCQRCAPAFEMRRRGYDVSAKPSIEYAYDDLKYHPEAVWESPDVRLTTGNGKADIEAAMSGWGDGARAEIVTYWKDGGGHAFSAEQVDGSTRFVDAQSGSEDVDWYFELNKPDGSTRFWRTDTAIPSTRISDCCRRRTND